jgi:carbamoyl-phosphate synthase small subunit
MKAARLIFEDGTVFRGRVFAEGPDRFGEAVFNTSMTGYQEVLTDPSYKGQLVLMTYPLIGSYGTTPEDSESRGLFLEALLVKEYIPFVSNFRSTASLKTYLEDAGVIGVENLDTRAITRHIRDKGAQRCLITTSEASLSDLVESIKHSPSMAGQNLADVVSCKEAYTFPAQGETHYKVAVIDTGIKTNILRLLASHGCECRVYPSNVSANTLLSGGYDGLFIANGPGDPEPLTHIVATIQAVLGKLPIFGICLGNQLLGLALGGKTYKLKFGHHGANHPVKNLLTGKVEITSQNHGFCIDPASFATQDIEITHINLNDNTVEGFRHKHYPAFSVQYHPEAAPGPHDSRYLFTQFTTLMAIGKSR